MSINFRRVCFICACIIIGLPSVEAQWRTFLNAPSVINGLRFDDVYFTDRMHGSLVTPTGVIHTTFDGGLNWHSNPPLDIYLRAVEYISPDTGFVGSIDGELLITTDGGLNWSFITDRLPGMDKAICGIDHVDGGFVYAVGSYAGPPVLFISENRGDTWEKIELDSLLDGAVDVYFRTPDEGFICGIGPNSGDMAGEGRILHTVDGGQTWRIAGSTDKALTYVWKMEFHNDGRAYASVQTLVGNRPSYLQSEDGGVTWSFHEFEIGLEMPFDAQAIGFEDANTGWLAGYGEGIFMTTDAGNTWTRMPETRNINRIFRVDSAYWVAAGFELYSYESGEVAVKESSYPEEIRLPHEIVSITPNPGRNVLELTYRLDHSTQVRIDIYTMEGRHISLLNKNYKTEGEHKETIDVSAYAPGIYVAIVRTHERHLRQLFVIAN